MTYVQMTYEDADDERWLADVLRRHADETGSPVAAALLADWPMAVTRFVKVMPRDYKRALLEERAAAGSRTPVQLDVAEVAHG